MKKYTYNNQNYEIIKNYKNGFEDEQIKELITEYFDNYDYIVGDWSYGKLRLKGFCDKNNQNFKEINDINKVEEYLLNHCAYDCRYFILKKIP